MRALECTTTSQKATTLLKGGMYCSDHADAVPCCCESPTNWHSYVKLALVLPLSVAVCKFRLTNLLWLQTLLALFSIDDVTGFQITNLVELPEPYGIIFLWGAVFPSIFIFVASITNFVFKDNLILKVGKQSLHVDALNCVFNCDTLVKTASTLHQYLTNLSCKYNNLSCNGMG